MNLPTILTRAAATSLTSINSLRIVLQVAASPGCRLIDAARALDLRKNHLASSARSLESAGLLIRRHVQSPGGFTYCYLHLTESGERLVRSIYQGGE